MTKGTTSSRERWLDAGRHLLATRGASSLKLNALTARAELTSGSFYHHFGNLDAFLTALADSYVPGTVEILDRYHDDDPTERLGRLLGDPEILARLPLDQAMREWGGSFPPAADAMQRADAIGLELLEQVLAELGHDAETARTRALMLLRVGVGRVDVPQELCGSLHREVMALAAAPPPPPAPAPTTA